jgi:hypothetical protein
MSNILESIQKQLLSWPNVTSEPHPPCANEELNKLPLALTIIITSVKGAITIPNKRSTFLICILSYNSISFTRCSRITTKEIVK